MPPPIRVSIVEDDTPLRQSIAILLDGSNGFACLGAYPSAETALKQIPDAWPDVLLMDINLPKMSGIQCVAGLKALNPDLHVIMLTICDDDDQVFESLKAGASGYLLKKASPAEILDAIAEVHSGGSPMSGIIARKVVRYFQQQPKPVSPATDLTRRELEVLDCLGKGFQYKEIASALSISGFTVRTHIDHIYQKLRVHSRTEAVVKHLKGESRR